jgi:predicted transcriptional regulator
MPERQFKSLLRRRNAGAALRREVVLQALARPRTQAELQTRLGMSSTGTLHLLRRMERDGLVRAAERVGVTRIWEKAPGGG